MADPDQSLYDSLGGDAGLRNLVERFYKYMHEREDAKELRAIHPEDLNGSIDKLYTFLSGWSGGPQLFVQKYGPPMLRRRHFPFAIGKRERDQWMICMVHAIEDHQVNGQPLPDEVRTYLINAFMKVAEHMRNQPAE